MTIDDPTQAAVARDLASTRFKLGVRRGYWRVVQYGFPLLKVAVASIGADGSPEEHFFRFELNGFPSTAPMVQIWSAENDQLLDSALRPTGTLRVNEAFKHWGNNTVYRPWERLSGAHNNWTQSYPNLAWHPRRDLTFILEDIHELLDSRFGARCAGKAA